MGVKKMKVSKVKRQNQRHTKLAKQGKLKLKRHKRDSLKKSIVHEVQRPQYESEIEESDNGEDLMEMVEDDDLKFLKKAVSDRSYSILKKVKYNDNQDKPAKRKRKKEELDNIEETYEEEHLEEFQNKKMKQLLPIKTKFGLVRREVEEEDVESDRSEAPSGSSIQDEKENDDDGDKEDESDEEVTMDKDQNGCLDPRQPLSVAELLAYREEVVQKRKFQIGVLCSGLLESPEEKIKNFKKLLDMFDEKSEDAPLTTTKYLAVSLLEVFSDLLPSYQIKHQENPGVKLKKDTLKLQEFEKSLLKAYKIYLQKMEKLVSVLKTKKGNTRKATTVELKLAKIAINCMCQLLVKHPYFNFSINLVQLLIPFLNNRLADIREEVSKCMKTVFKEDKRGEISLHIVRCINHMVKSRGHAVHPDVLGVLLALRIKEVNLDKEKEDEIKKKKFMTHKQKLLKMSKKERKRSKKLEELEKELLETKAEENKQTKHKLLTEITKIVFTIYFRILKTIPSSKLLSVTLEGLARFAHCINLDFYHDLVNVINNLMSDESIGYREQLYCIQTIFKILSGQGEVLNVDPQRFYAHLYKNLLLLHAGKNHRDMLIVVNTLEIVLNKHRKKITQQRLLSFTKRVATLALQLLPNGALSCLSFIKTILQLNKTVDILLDPDTSIGEGKYLPELEEPEYCNAGNSALWEVILLLHHYHPTVRRYSKHVLMNVPASGEGSIPPDIAKLSSEELFVNFDPSEMAFRPAVPAPRKGQVKPHKGRIDFCFGDFEEIDSSLVDCNIDCNVDFFAELCKR